MGAARYKPYPAYKPSGVEWLGDIPEGWELKPCRAVVDHHANKNSSGQSENYLSLMANVGVIPYADKGDVGNKKPDDLSKCKIVRKGDLVINSMNYAIGSYGMSAYDGICSPVYIILSAQRENLLDRFALRVFENRPFQKHLAVFGNGILEHRAAIGWDTIKGQYVPVPPIQEQDTILKFLDFETGKIDALIAKQERLIDLLEEKRQAVISHAVTKGLNPNAPLRPSGIDWLGDVPEHWEVKNFRYATQIYRGKFGHRPRNDPSLFRGGTLPFIQTGDVAQAEKYIETFKQTLNRKGASVSELFPAGTLVMAIAANIGDTAILNFEAYAPDSVVGFRPGEGVDLEFLRFCSIAALPALEQTSTQSTQANLNIDRIGSVKVAIPPRTEQREIADSLEAISKKHTALNERAQSAVTLLKERRTALISAAVTGKIDVRDWQPPQPLSDTDLSTETLQEAIG